MKIWTLDKTGLGLIPVLGPRSSQRLVLNSRFGSSLEVNCQFQAATFEKSKF